MYWAQMLRWQVCAMYGKLKELYTQTYFADYRVLNVLESVWINAARFENEHAEQLQNTSYGKEILAEVRAVYISILALFYRSRVAEKTYEQFRNKRCGMRAGHEALFFVQHQALSFNTHYFRLEPLVLMELLQVNLHEI